MTGPAGDTGATGATGSSGGTTATAISMADIADRAVSVTNDGMLVQFVGLSYYGGIDSTGLRDTFILPDDGAYLFRYKVTATEPVLMTSQLLVNSDIVTGTIFTPDIATTTYESMLILNCSANDRISVQLVGDAGAITLKGLAGTTLHIIRIA